MILVTLNDPRVAYAVVQRLIEGFTIEGRSGANTLMWTDASIADLNHLQPYVSRPHFQARGWWRGCHGTVAELLRSDTLMLDLAFRYPDGNLGVGLGRTSDGEAGSIQLVWNTGADRLRLTEHAALLRELTGSEWNAGRVRESLPSGITLNGQMGTLPEHLFIKFDSNFNGPSAFRSIVATLEPTDLVHSMATGSFEAVHETGQHLRICTECCGWMYGYGNVAALASDVQPGAAEEIAALLFRSRGRERSMRWSGFRWRHDLADPMGQNGVILRVTDGAVVQVEVRGRRSFPTGVRVEMAKS